MSREILAKIIATLPDGKPRQVCIGPHWTAVVMDMKGELRCGLASSLKGNHHCGVSDVFQAGALENMAGLASAELTQADASTLVRVWMAPLPTYIFNLVMCMIVVFGFVLRVLGMNVQIGSADTVENPVWGRYSPPGIRKIENFRIRPSQIDGRQHLLNQERYSHAH